MFLKAYSLSTQKVHGGTYKPPKPVFSFWDSNPIPMWQVTVTSRLSDEESRTVRTGAGSGCAGVTTGLLWIKDDSACPELSWIMDLTNEAAVKPLPPARRCPPGGPGPCLIIHCSFSGVWRRCSEACCSPGWVLDGSMPAPHSPPATVPWWIFRKLHISEPHFQIPVFCG
uniref:Uncharacterized protein n=1 Tax=Mustela putorius furo TaxID=9669 RepID=M3Y9C9_MUSPF